MDIEPLSRWLNAFAISQGPMSRHSLRNEQPTLFDALQKQGIIREDQLATSIDCPECLGEHSVRVQRIADGRYRYLCIHNGLIEVARKDLAMVRLDREALLSALARSIGKPERSIRRFADDRLIRIGLVEPGINQIDWMFCYADGLEANNALTAVIGSLEGDVKGGPGLVVTPSSISHSIPLPNRYKLIALHDLIRLRGGHLVVQDDAAQSRMGYGAKVPGKRGPKSKKPITELIWNEERKKSDWPADRGKQAGRVHALWPQDRKPAPPAGTIENHIRELLKSDPKA
jgi:hypothetical protein